MGPLAHGIQQRGRVIVGVTYIERVGHVYSQHTRIPVLDTVARPYPGKVAVLKLGIEVQLRRRGLHVLQHKARQKGKIVVDLKPVTRGEEKMGDQLAGLLQFIVGEI